MCSVARLTIVYNLKCCCVQKRKVPLKPQALAPGEYLTVSVELYLDCTLQMHVYIYLCRTMQSWDKFQNDKVHQFSDSIVHPFLVTFHMHGVSWMHDCGKDLFSFMFPSLSWSNVKVFICFFPVLEWLFGRCHFLRQ